MSVLKRVLGQIVEENFVFWNCIFKKVVIIKEANFDVSRDVPTLYECMITTKKVGYFG